MSVIHPCGHGHLQAHAIPEGICWPPMISGGPMSPQEAIRHLADEHRQRMAHVYNESENRGTNCLQCDALLVLANLSTSSLRDEGDPKVFGTPRRG